MRKIYIGLLFTVITSAAILTTAGPSWLRLEGAEKNKFRYMMEAPVNSPYEMARYVGWLKQNNFDVAGYSWRDKKIEVITDDEGIKKLELAKIRGKIIQSSNSKSAPIDPRYLNPAKVEAKLKALNAQFPNLTHLEQIGTSNQGRAIWALLISNTPDIKSAEYYQKPSIIFDGMHHAREIMTPEVVMDVADVLLNQQTRSDARWSQLMNNWNIWIVPMLNVDGNNIVWTQDAWWRKNARAENGRTFGVDINRNYDFKWQACNGSSGSTSSDTYRGPAAASEPETQALSNLAQKVVPTGSLSYHSYSELVIYPYGCSGVFTGENALLAKIGGELAQLLPSDSRGGTYTPGTAWQLLYSVDGDSSSYMFGEFGAVSFTFEVNQEFQPSYDLREPTLIKHRKAWAYYINRLNQNLLSLKVIDGKTGQPAQAQIRIANIILSQGEKPYRTNIGGNYFKVLDPGKYTFGVVLKDGRKTQFDIEMKGAPLQHVITIN
ncbi:MAG: M14 family zinc carboxypeptidase [Bdellovibrionota bacterium]